MNDLYATINNTARSSLKQLKIPTIPGEQIKEVRQTGNNLVLIVDIKILKTGMSDIIIACDEASKKYAEIVHVILEELLSDMEKVGNTIEGFIVDLSNGYNHPTDFNSNKAKIYFYNYFHKLLENNN